MGLNFSQPTRPKNQKSVPIPHRGLLRVPRTFRWSWKQSVQEKMGRIKRHISTLNIVNLKIILPAPATQANTGYLCVDYLWP